jgi:hypothetical protein
VVIVCRAQRDSTLPRLDGNGARVPVGSALYSADPLLKPGVPIIAGFKPVENGVDFTLDPADGGLHVSS